MIQPLSWRRFLPVIVLLVFPSLVLARRSRREVLPAYRPLADFPAKIDDLRAQDLALTHDELRLLGPGQFLLRNYISPAGEPPINLYVAFFPSQRSGDTIHSPKNCLPGAGWAPLESRRILLREADGSAAPVERYLIGRGADRDIVLYWYQAHGRITSSEYLAKFYLVADAIRMNRTDGALVRVVVPVEPDVSAETAQTRAVQFAETILRGLGSYIPK
jgi:EpsI family protein